MTGLLKNRNHHKGSLRLLATVLFGYNIPSTNESFTNSWNAVRYPKFVQIAVAPRDCDALAASPGDHSRPADVAGVPFSEIDATHAEAACRRAIQERPSPQIFFQLGRALDAGHKDAEAVTNYRTAADQGYAAAQSNLGSMYESGRGVTRDQAQAVFWYRKAADQGFALAQSNLGVMYAHGRGVARDDAQAVFWYRKAAEQGDTQGENRLTLMYFNGRGGLGWDYAQAVLWYRKAAEQGFAIAQANLGAMYAHGQGVARDDAQAVLWYRKAAQQGDAQAQKNLAAIQQQQAPTPARPEEKTIEAQLENGDPRLEAKVLSASDAVSLRCANGQFITFLTLSESSSGVVNKGPGTEMADVFIDGRVITNGQITAHQKVNFYPNTVVVDESSNNGERIHIELDRRYQTLSIKQKGNLFGIPINGTQELECQKLPSKRQF